MSVLKKYGWMIAAVVAVLITFFVVYRPTLFNFLIADDYLLMGWTYQAVNQPKMLLEQYFTTHPLVAAGFYRPILSTILWLGYKAWGTNGLYFRLLNMAFELLAGLMLGLVTLALNKETAKKQTSDSLRLSIWALFSAILFVLYPLHSESVNWITVMTNPLMAVLSLFSLWSYIRWRNESKREFLILSILSCFLAFLTKENAATLPAIIFVYELMFLQGNANQSNASTTKQTYIKILYDCSARTFPYWAILGLYFCLRKLVLGEFIAGYPDYMCPQSIAGWLHGVRDIFIPTNFMLIATHSVISKAWHAVLFILILLTIIATVRANKNQRKVIFFLVFWFLLALAPSYKIFPSAMNTIVGSRLAYLCTMPLCMFLTYGLSQYTVAPNRFIPLVRCFSIVAFGLAAVILYINNQAWAEAGIWTNRVVGQLQNYYRKIAGDPLVYIAGLPAGSKSGVYCLGALRWTTLRPFFDRDLINCVRLENECYISPISIKEAVNRGAPIILLYWDSQNEILKPVFVPVKTTRLSTRHLVSNLKEHIHVSFLPSNSDAIIHWSTNGNLELKSPKKNIAYAILDISLPALQCWDTNFIALKLQLALSNKNIPIEPKLCFTNSLVDEPSMKANICLGIAKPTAQGHEIFFPLQNISNWSMGGKCSSIKIVIPFDQNITITELLIPDSLSLAPYVNFKVSVDDRPGQLRLGPKSPYPGNIEYDAHSIDGAKQVMLEAAQVGTVHNGDVDPSKIKKSFLFRKHLSNVRGHFTIDKTQFPSEPAIYKAWLKALDKNGQQSGFQSNDFYIRTDY